MFKLKLMTSEKIATTLPYMQINNWYQKLISAYTTEFFLPSIFEGTLDKLLSSTDS